MKKKYVTKYSEISDSELLLKLKEAAVLLGGFVSSRDVNKLDDFPNCNIYEKRFGTWGKALRLVNLPTKPTCIGNPENNHNANLRTRFEILSRDNFTCQYCGRTPQDGAKLVVDHIIPFSKGGKTISENLITSCSKCNAGKSDIVLGR